MKTVLVVDDDQTSRRLVGFQMERHGFAVEFATNGMEAVSKSRDREFSLIIIDVYMPEMDGIDAVMAIRAYDASKQRVRVPIVSTSSDDEVRSRMLEAGADVFFVKPSLFEMLDKFLSYC